MSSRSPWRLDGVPAASLRGLLGLALLAAMFLGVFLPALLEAARVIATGAARPAPTVSRALFYVNIAYSIIFLLFLPLFYLKVVRPRRRVGPELGLSWKPTAMIHVIVGAFSTLAVLFLIGGILYALNQAGVFHEDPSEVLVELRPVLTWDLIILIPISSALSEEIFFRGFLQPRLGLVPTALLFGLVHIGYGTVLQVVVPVVLGLFFGLLYRWTRTLWAPIAGHFAFNFLQLLLLYTFGP